VYNSKINKIKKNALNKVPIQSIFQTF